MHNGCCYILKRVHSLKQDKLHQHRCIIIMWCVYKMQHLLRLLQCRPLVSVKMPIARCSWKWQKLHFLVMSSELKCLTFTGHSTLRCVFVGHVENSQSRCQLCYWYHLPSAGAVLLSQWPASQWRLDTKTRAELSWAALLCAALRCAELLCSELSWAELRWAELRWTELSCTALRCSALRCSELSWVELSWADRVCQWSETSLSVCSGRDNSAWCLQHMSFASKLTASTMHRYQLTASMVHRYQLCCVVNAYLEGCPKNSSVREYRQVGASFEYSFQLHWWSVCVNCRRGRLDRLSRTSNVDVDDWTDCRVRQLSTWTTGPTVTYVWCWRGRLYRLSRTSDVDVDDWSDCRVRLMSTSTTGPTVAFV